MLHIDMGDPVTGPRTERLFSALKTMILAGELPEGEKLPSTRGLSEELGLSRTVVLEAYDRLLSEGYVEAREGSGTFVSNGLLLPCAEPEAVPDIPPAGFLPLRTDIIDFRSGVPDLSHFPFAAWKAAQREVWDGLKPLDLSYSGPEGRLELRQSIVNHLLRFRGIRCRPEQIVITAGTTQAIGIVSRVLLERRGGTVVTEDPLTADISGIIRTAGGKPVPVPLDESGLDPRAIPPALAPRFLYVTPSHQFPLGMAMPIRRRIELIEYAREKDAYVVEDDYDSEFRYDTPPVGTLRELAPDSAVYLGTFSKTLFPSLRTAYVVFPPHLIHRGRLKKWETDLHNITTDQLVLSRFMDAGDYARHIASMRRIYRKKREALLKALEAGFRGTAVPLGSPTGLHVSVRFAGCDFSQENLAALERRGVKVYPVEYHAARKGRYRDCLILGFGMLDAESIARGIGILKTFLEESAANRGTP